jgi:hypothetical protein
MSRVTFLLKSWERMPARFVAFERPDNLEKRGGEIEMMVEPKRNPPPEDHDRANGDRRHQEEALDEALKNTFPASDPFSVEQLSSAATDREESPLARAQQK